MLKEINLPKKIIVKDLKNNHYQVTMEAFYPGYGATIGNSLRRVLLSSLPGSAVTSFKVENAQHEFDTIDGIKEDMVEIMLNLKSLRLKVFSTEPVKLKLEVKGEKVVKAKDIKKDSEVEIISKDLIIATITDKSVKLSMEIIVEQGLGYEATEQRENQKLEIGTISIDSSFSPVLNVGYKIENVRVGKMTNYEKLILDIITDGTMDVEEAINKASFILKDHFNLLIKKEKPKKEKPKKEKPKKEKPKKEKKK